MYILNTLFLVIGYVNYNTYDNFEYECPSNKVISYVKLVDNVYNIECVDHKYRQNSVCNWFTKKRLSNGYHTINAVRYIKNGEMYYYSCINDEGIYFLHLETNLDKNEIEVNYTKDSKLYTYSVYFMNFLSLPFGIFMICRIFKKM